MAAAGWAEPECLEEEGCREEVLIFGFVDVAECFAKASVNDGLAPVQDESDLREILQFPHCLATLPPLPSHPRPPSASAPSVRP